MLRYLPAADGSNLEIVTTSMTVVEAPHPGISRPALRWTLSRVKVEPVTDKVAVSAAELLRSAGLHGHGHAIDAVVAAIALAAPRPLAVLTSDPNDLRALCGDQVALIKV